MIGIITNMIGIITCFCFVTYDMSHALVVELFFTLLVFNLLTINDSVILFVY